MIKWQVKFHPDRAQQRGLGDAALLEAEETYKLIQNLYENYRRKASPTAAERGSGGSGKGSGSGRAKDPRGQGGHYGQRAGAGGPGEPRPRKPSAGPRGYGDGGGGGPKREQREQQQRPGSASTAREQRQRDNERFKPDWQKRAEAAAREHARPKEHREEAKFSGGGGGGGGGHPGGAAGGGGGGGGPEAGSRQAKQDAAHARARYQHKSSAEGEGERGAELRREVERRPKARRVAEQSLRELVRRQRLWFRNAREKQQLRDILFAKAMKGKGWSSTDEQTLQSFIGTLRAYS